MSGYDGPTLRAVRESMGVPLRRIARQAGMSHGHLSKVERGEHGRPVTPAILAAYERVTGVRLAEAAAGLGEPGEAPVAGRRGRSWRPGQLTEMRRQAFNAAVGAIAIGGQLGEPFGRLLDAIGRPVAPTTPDLADVAQLERVGELVTGLDLRYGGGLASQLTKALLRWAVSTLDAVSLDEQLSRRLHAAVCALAARAAWSAFDVAAHEAARSLFRLALYTAVRAGDPDLRAHVLADVAAQHNQLGYHEDSLNVVRLAEGDERVAPAVRMVLHGVKARAYAALGQLDPCRRHIALAEEVFTQASLDAPGWVGRLGHPTHLYATTGHAMALIAARSGDATDLVDAQQRLARAAEGFAPETHARARVLCTARLASLHFAAGDLIPAQRWTRQALTGAGEVRSHRVVQEIGEVRARAAAHLDDAATQELAAELDAVLTVAQAPVAPQQRTSG